MAYIDKLKAQSFLRLDCLAKYPDSFANGLLAAADQIGQMPLANVVDITMVKALEKDLERTGNELAKVEAERDALLEELQRLADCSSCKFNAPDAVDGCSALMPCKDGNLWEWKGAKK